MDLTQVFQNVGTATNLTITIKGTAEEPLFQANQIGRLLGITNIRKSIEDFDDDEKGVTTTYTLGGPQQTLFLTELGLYRLLGQSRKPVARPFQKWVAKVIREVRLNGKYELEQRTTKLLAEATEKEQQLQDALNEKEEELLRMKSKTYEEVPKEDKVYICKEASELSSNRHKIGKTLDPKKREAQLNTGSAQGSKIIYEKETLNAKLIEDIVQVVLKRYHCIREHYNCRVEHSVDVIDIATLVVDTLASSYEHMNRQDLLSIIIDKLTDLFIKCKGEDHIHQSDILGTLAKSQSPLATSKLHLFLSMDPMERVTHNDRVNYSGSRWLFTIEAVPDCVIWVEDFKSTYREVMNEELKELDGAVLAAFGFRASQKHENVCKSCRQLAKSRGGQCCPEYSNTNRVKKMVIHGLLVTSAPFK